MWSIAYVYNGGVPWRAHGARVVALCVTLVLLGGCASRGSSSTAGAAAAAAAAAAAGSPGGGVVQIVLFTLGQLLQMRRDLASAEGLAATRRGESQEASARARVSTRSADWPRLTAEAANATAAATEADTKLAQVQATLARELGLTGVPRPELSVAIRRHIAQLEAALVAEEQR